MAKRKKRESKFKGKTTANAKKQKSQGASYGHLKLPKGVSVFKEEGGTRVTLDFLPYVVTDPKHPDRDDEHEIALKGDLWYKRPYKLHRNIGSDKQSVVCPGSIGKKCPICEYRAKLLKEGAEYTDDAVKALKTSARNLYVVVPKNNKKYEEIPHIWDISQYLFQDKLNDELDEDEDYGVFPDLEEGLSLRIRFSSEKLGKNEFADTSRIDFKERKKQYDEDILDEVPNLDELLDIKSYKELEALFLEVEDDDDDDESEERPRTSRRKKSALKDEHKDEDDDLDYEDEDEDEDEDPDYDEDEDEEDEDDDLDYEDDEDEDDDPDEEDEEDEEEEEDEIDIPEEERCIACGGTGKASKGGPCRACKGTGRKQKQARNKKPKPSRNKKSKPSRNKKPKPSRNKKPKNKCPFGHTFGVDCEEFDDCDDCDLWDECIEEKEA